MGNYLKLLILGVIVLFVSAKAQAADLSPEMKKLNQTFYVYRSPDFDSQPAIPKPLIKSPRPPIIHPTKPPAPPLAQNNLEDDKGLLNAEMHSAELGDTDALFSAGMKLYHGKGVVQDRKKALRWLLIAAEDGKFSLESLNIIGQAYFKGIDIEKNYVESRRWLSLLANQDSYSGKNDLAYMLYNGLGGDKDYAKAFQLYMQASVHGDVLAQANLGLMYATGAGTKIDKIRAYAWCSIAASQGNVVAARNRNAISEDMSSTEINLSQRVSVDIYNEIKNHKIENPSFDQ